MKLYTKVLTSIFFSLLSFIVCAEDFTVVNVGLSNNSNSIFIRVQEEFPHGCSVPQNIKTFVWSIDNVLYKEIYSTALTALATGKKLNISYGTSSTDCINNHPTTKSLFIKN